MKKTINIALWELDNPKNTLKIPVLPDSLPTSVGGKAEIINIEGAGERVIFGGEKLADFSIEAFFPAIHDASYVNGTAKSYSNPDESLRKLRAWCDLEQPLYVYSKEGPINRPVVITNLQYERQRAGHIDDVWYTVDFIYYKAPNYRRVALKKSSGSGGVKTPAKKPTAQKASKLPASYTVKKGDYLGKVAMAFYGKAKYAKIYNANKKTIDAANKKAKARDKYTIYPGQKLTIPK